MKILIPLLVFSSAAYSMQSLDDETLGQVEGQAGITIETTQGDLTIGEVRYTDADGDGERHTDAGSIVLSDISIGAGSMTTKIDVTDGVNGTFLNLEFSDITAGDIWVRNIALGDENTTFGAVGITNFNFDPSGSYNVRFGSYDDGSDRYAAIIYNLDMADSSYDFTFVEEGEFAADGTLLSGLQLSYKNQFTNFVANDTRIYIDDNIDVPGRNWARLSLGDIQGSAELQNLTLGGGTKPTQLGSVGFSGAQIQDSSFIAISAH